MKLICVMMFIWILVAIWAFIIKAAMTLPVLDQAVAAFSLSLMTVAILFTIYIICEEEGGWLD